MVRVPYLRSRLVAAAFLGISAAPVAAQGGLYTWDFDDGTLQGWSATGAAFINQPTFGNNVAVRRPGESPGQDGDWWIGTYENRRSNGVPPGSVQGDGPQGNLVSPAFRIEGPTISLLVGGGGDPNSEFVGLLIRSRPGLPPPPGPDYIYRFPDGDYQLTLTATGRNDEHMTRTFWDVHAYAGETARIIAVDRSSAPWGHINFDSVNLPWRPPLGHVGGSGLGTAVPVNPGQSGTAYPVGGGSIVVQPPAQGQPQGQGLGTAVPVNQGQSQPVYVPPAGSGGTEGSGVIVSPPSNQPPAGVRSAHYQLIAYRVHVISATADGLAESDGPGDEIRVRSDVFRFSPTGVMTGWIPHLGRIMGSTDYIADIFAGSARPTWSAHDEQGGFRNGDDYPPAERQNTLSPNGGLPMLLWEGDLTEANEVVVIVPSLWEIDSRSRSAAEIDWDRDLPNLMRGRSAYFSSIANRPIEDNDVPEEYLIVSGFSPTRGGNEPLAYFGGDDRRRPGAWVNSIVLTYNRAAYWAAKPGRYVNPVHQWVGTGEMMLDLGNSPESGGYELFMRLVRTR